MEKRIPDKKKTGDSFSMRARSYGTSPDHIGGSDLTFLESFLEREPIDTVLDISTGAGHTAGILKRHCREVIAVDIAFGMLVEARKRFGGGNISFSCGDSERLPFLRDVFSLVTCRIAAHHFPDIPSFLEEVARVLRNGGFLVLIDSTVPVDPELGTFLNRMEKIRDATHVSSLSVGEWERLLKSAGFRISVRSAFRKKHDFSLWLERTDPQREQEGRLEEMIRTAGDRVREYYRFEIAGGKILSYTDDKTLFLCVKE